MWQRRNDGGWRPYVSVSARRAKAARLRQSLAKKGVELAPVVIEGRGIARTFWGRAWCDNLERYSDYENRLPRGRTYVRNGSVIDLQIGAGRVTGLVQGSDLYHVTVKVKKTPPAAWTALKKDLTGGIGSLVDLLQGRLAEGVMERICRPKEGLFPALREIELSCSCPDWADMCKHVAAVLYGVGARLDEAPELLFRLRQVDEHDLIAEAAGAAAGRDRAAPANVLGEADALEAIFGIDLGPATPTRPRKKAAAKRKAKAKTRAKAKAKPKAKTKAKTKAKATARPQPKAKAKAKAKPRKKK